MKPPKKIRLDKDYQCKCGQVVKAGCVVYRWRGFQTCGACHRSSLIDASYRGLSNGLGVIP